MGEEKNQRMVEEVQVFRERSHLGKRRTDFLKEIIPWPKDGQV